MLDSAAERYLPPVVLCSVLAFVTLRQEGSSATAPQAERQYRAKPVWEPAPEPPSNEGGWGVAPALWEESYRKRRPDVLPAAAVSEAPPVELTPEERRNLALSAIDELAAHPEDPQRPARVRGVSDEELAATDPNEIELLLEIALPHAEAVKDDDPRYLFEIGRAAVAIGQEEQGYKLLKEASRSGSAAALAYCAARGNLSNDRAWRFLDDAYERGFKPAKEWAERYGKNLAPGFQSITDEQLSELKRPDILKAIHNRSVDGLDAGTLEVWADLASLIGGVSDPQLLYLVDREQVRELRALQNPGLTARIEAKLLSDQSYIRESSKLGIAGVLNGFQAMAQARKSGMSITDEVSAFTKQITKNTVPVNVAKEQGAHDAMTIALDLPLHGRMAKNVMDGVEWYFDDGIRQHQGRMERIEAERRGSGGRPSMGDAFIDWASRRRAL